MQKIFLVTLAVAVSCFLYIQAGKATPPALQENAPKCLNENAQLTLNFNGTENDINAIKDRFDSQIHDAEDIAKGMGVEEITMNSSNYNINSQNYYTGDNGMQFGYNGNVVFKIVPTNKATDLMAALTKKGYRVYLNMNSRNYTGPNCNAAAARAILAAPAPAK